MKSAYSLAWKIEAACFSETLVDFQQTAWHYIAEDRSLRNNCCEMPSIPQK